MIRWSPISSVFSIDPDGITRACPSVPLISMNARITQNQAMISLFTRAPSDESAASLADPFLMFTFAASAFTFHRHYLFDFRRCCVFANLQLHQVGRIDTRITRRTEVPCGVIHRLPQPGKRQVPQRIRAQVLADLLRSVRRRDQLLARRRVHAVIARRNRWRATDAHVYLLRPGLADHPDQLAARRSAYDRIVHQDYAFAGD